MSMTWKLDTASNDVKIVGGKLVKVQGAEEVRQRILVTLKHFWNEYWLNLQGGVPWYELILGGKNPQLSAAVLRKIILSVPNVVGMIRFDSSFKDRQLKIDCVVEVQTINGNATVNIQV